jgi:hypothetical protein
MDISYDFLVPTPKEYTRALKKIKKQMTDRQKKMLEHHFKAFKWTITFAKLADAMGTAEYQQIIDEYSELGKLLGDQLSMEYLASASKPGEPFYCSSIGSGNPYRAENESYSLVMHRELIEALYKLKWFK